MIIDLTIENFKSFRGATTVSFASGMTSRLSGNLLRHRNGERFVKSMAVYGHNASGKTTVLDALYALGTFSIFSSQDQKPTAEVPRFESFALDRSHSQRPARVALTIELEDKRYIVDVSATPAQVWSESLKVQHMARQPSRKTPTTTLFSRTWHPENGIYSVTLHEELGTELTRSAVKEQTTPNRLMLGKLAAMNSDVARRIIEWFDKDLKFYDMHRNPFSEGEMLEECARLLKENSDFAAAVVPFIRDADIGIREFRVSDEKTVEAHYSEPDNKFEFKERIKPSLSFGHSTEDGSEVFFRQQRESSGTLRFVALLVAILQPSPRRRLVCIDELSASMHPDLVRRLLLIVHSNRCNQLGHQILFTTHDTHLIDPKELLRRDQVTICGKDRFGRSTTKRLDEFHDSARSDANLQKQYLQGRFGGKPQFGPTLEDVQVDDDPLEVP